MKNLVIQYYIDINKYSNPTFNNLGPSPIEKYSSYSFKKYCDKYNIDYIKITEPKLGFKHPTWERFDLWCDRSWWDKYDQICYVYLKNLKTPMLLRYAIIGNSLAIQPMDLKKDVQIIH
jgi:hypothetical protein